MPIPSVTGFSNLVHHHLPNTAFAIVEEVYQRLPELMNLRNQSFLLMHLNAVTTMAYLSKRNIWIHWDMPQKV